MKSAIARYRVNKGLTQAQLAKRIGKSRSVVAAYETDASGVPIDTLWTIAKVLDVSVEVLFEENDTPTQPRRPGRPPALMTRTSDVGYQGEL